MIIDIHRHVLPVGARDWLRQEGAAVGVELIGGSVRHVQGFRWPLTEAFTEHDAVIAGLTSSGLDAAVISIPPPPPLP